jgi:hypothetical protein
VGSNWKQNLGGRYLRLRRGKSSQNQFSNRSLSNRSLVSKPATHQVSALLLASTTPPTCMGSAALVTTHEASQATNARCWCTWSDGSRDQCEPATLYNSFLPFLFYSLFFIQQIFSHRLCLWMLKKNFCISYTHSLSLQNKLCAQLVVTKKLCTQLLVTEKLMRTNYSANNCAYKLYT